MTGHVFDPPCECSHLKADHNSGRGQHVLAPVRWGVCLVPGCDCREYQPVEHETEARAA